MRAHRHPGLDPGPAYFSRLTVRRQAPGQARGDAFWLAIVAILLAIPTSPAPAQTNASVDYSKDSSWLCLPSRADICAAPLATTDLPASGYGARTTANPVPNPPIDCFYVYPTVSHDQGLNSDLTPSAVEEKVVAQNQLARFASVCRPFAPMYRQMTVGAVTLAATGGDMSAAFGVAYADVAAAFRQFTASRSPTRPFVLIGHSQGSWMLQTLIAREIEGKPIAARMKLAIIPGFDVLVPVGKRVGGTFKSTPLCSRAGETGCVLAWSSYREKNVPPEGALFGYAAKPGMTVACTNPAALGSPAWTKLDSYWTRGGWPSVPGGPISWSSEGSPPTPFLHTGDLVSGRCVNDGPRGYLSIRTSIVPGQKRTDRIGGEIGMLGFFLPGWGMHLNDIAAVQGDLIRRIADISRR